jgi:hypothetical protein
MLRFFFFSGKSEEQTEGIQVKVGNSDGKIRATESGKPLIFYLFPKCREKTRTKNISLKKNN